MHSTDDTAAITAITRFWFADIGNSYDFGQQQQRWYQGGEELDLLIKQQFGDLLAAAKQQQLVHWTGTASGALALILLLDQFSRHIFRQTAQAFAADPLARSTLERALQQGLDQQLNPLQRSFFYKPLQHAESLPHQQRAVLLFEGMEAEVPAAGKPWFNASLRFFQHHRDVIARFGRFPHRNAVLGRISTPAELDWLQQSGSRFGQ